MISWFSSVFSAFFRLFLDISRCLRGFSRVLPPSMFLIESSSCPRGRGSFFFPPGVLSLCVNQPFSLSPFSPLSFCRCLALARSYPLPREPRPRGDPCDAPKSCFCHGLLLAFPVRNSVLHFTAILFPFCVDHPLFLFSPIPPSSFHDDSSWFFVPPGFSGRAFRCILTLSSPRPAGGPLRCSQIAPLPMIFVDFPCPRPFFLFPHDFLLPCLHLLPFPHFPIFRRFVACFLLDSLRVHLAQGCSKILFLPGFFVGSPRPEFGLVSFRSDSLSFLPRPSISSFSPPPRPPLASCCRRSFMIPVSNSKEGPLRCSTTPSPRTLFLDFPCLRFRLLFRTIFSFFVFLRLHFCFFRPFVIVLPWPVFRSPRWDRLSSISSEPEPLPCSRGPFLPPRLFLLFRFTSAPFIHLPHLLPEHPVRYLLR